MSSQKEEISELENELIIRFKQLVDSFKIQNEMHEKLDKIQSKLNGISKLCEERGGVEVSEYRAILEEIEIILESD